MRGSPHRARAGAVGGPEQGGRQVEAGRGAVVVGDHGGAGGDLGLARDAAVDHAVEFLVVTIQGGEHGVVGGEGPVEQFGGDVAGEVIGGRPEAAGDDDDFRALAKRVEQRVADGGAVGHADLTVNAQAEVEKFLSEEGEVGVGDVAEEELGAGVDDFDFQAGREGKWESGEVRRRDRPNPRLSADPCINKRAGFLDRNAHLSARLFTRGFDTRRQFSFTSDVLQGGILRKSRKQPDDKLFITHQW